MKMKLLLLIVFCVVAASQPLQAEQIALWDTPISGRCALEAPAGVPLSVYVVHTLSPGAKGSSWRIENTSSVLSLGGSCTGLSITGDPFTGISVSYGSCLTGTFAICQLTFLKITASPIPGCYHLNVLPSPPEASVGIVGCDDTPRSAVGGYFSFDPDPENKIPPCDDCTTAIDPTTWGAVKALYR